MKRLWVGVFGLFFCLPASVFAQGSGLEEYPASGSFLENVKANPYAQVGFQKVGSNLNLPVENEALTPFLNIGDLDITLQGADFWTGIAGVNVTVNEIFSFFGSAGGFLNRPFVTSGTVPVSLGALGVSPTLEFTNTKVESWFIQTGIGLGPVLLGLYWDHFAFAFGDARNVSGPNQPNPTLRGDILTKTFSPFFGVVIPSGGAMLTVTYSPLAYSNTALSLTSSQDVLTQLRYTWNKPGQLLNAVLQYNTPVSSSFSFGLWGNYSWMKMRGEAQLEFQNTPIPLVSRSRDVTATMTKYVVGGGVTLAVNF